MGSIPTASSNNIFLNSNRQIYLLFRIILSLRMALTKWHFPGFYSPYPVFSKYYFIWYDFCILLKVNEAVFLRLRLKSR